MDWYQHFKKELLSSKEQPISSNFSKFYTEKFSPEEAVKDIPYINKTYKDKETKFNLYNQKILHI